MFVSPSTAEFQALWAQLKVELNLTDGDLDMGYTFVIGNAAVDASKDDWPELSAKWRVKYEVLNSAPNFPGDDTTGQSNSRSPSYSAWHYFCEDVGIFELFFDEMNRLKAEHPGCIGITRDDLKVVEDAVARRRALSTKEPGYADDDSLDYNLARLLWLEWWMKWALDNCETPAIENW